MNASIVDAQGPRRGLRNLLFVGMQLIAVHEAGCFKKVECPN
jgi:hypothetical protein